VDSKKWPFVFAAFSGIGGLTSFLLWLGIKPQDLWRWDVSIPHWLSLVGALLLFVFSFGLSTYGLYYNRTPPQESSSGQWKPKCQKLQWANADRERLEGEVRKWKDMYTAENYEKTDFQKEMARTKNRAEELERQLSEATKPDASLRGRTIAKCDELKDFLREYGPRPDVMQKPGETEGDHAQRIKVLFERKAKMGADFRLRLSDSVKRIRDEIQVRCGMAEAPLDKAIELAESQLCEPSFVEAIRACLWRFASTMSK
jgi:hypothetical protein